MQWGKDRKIRNNVDQACGWLVLLGAREYGKVYSLLTENQAMNVHIREKTLEEYFSPGEQDSISGWECGAYEPCSHIKRSDIEYLYTINLEDLTITIEDIYNNTTDVIQI